jgi:hypothetical protein
LQITTPSAVCAPNGVDLTQSSITNGSTVGLQFGYYTNNSASSILSSPNNVTAAGTYYIQAIDTSSGCKTTNPVNVIINAPPYLANYIAPDVCSGASTNISLVGNVPSSFNWSINSNPNNVIGASTGSGNLITQNLINPNNSNSAYVTYNVVPIANTTGCVGDTDVVTVAVNPVPTVVSTTSTKICTSGTSSLQANPTSGNILWYSSNTGGNPIAMGLVYNTPSLNSDTVYYAQANYGTCTNGIRTPVNVVVENPGQWLGYSNDWNTLSNWGCNLLPTTTTNVIIPTSPDGGFYPIVSTNSLAVCKNLLINSSSSVTINSGKDLNVYGDIINNGSPSFGNGKLSLNGNVLQYISGAAIQKVNHLFVNNSKTGNAVKLNVDMQVDSVLEFATGRLSLNGKNMTLGTASQDGVVIGAGINKHLNAELGYFICRTNNNSTYSLPLGDSTDYTPFTISFISGTQPGSAIQSKVTKGKEPNLIVTTDYLNRYWTIEPINLLANVDYDVMYNYQNIADVIGTGVLYPIKYNTLNGWSGCPGSNANTILGITGSHNVAAKSFTWYGLNSFSNFTGAGNSSPLPIQLLSFNAIKNNQQVDCKWSTALEFNNDYFTIERSEDALNFNPIGITDGAGNSNSILNYQFTDYNPFVGINYYRLRQTDFDGHSTVSEIKAVNMDVDSDVKLLSAYFANEELVFNFNQGVAINKLNLYDVLGRVVYSEDYNNGVFAFDKINIPYLLSGNYFLELSIGDKLFSKKLIKL